MTRLKKRVNGLRWELKIAAMGGAVAALTPLDKIHAQDLGPFIKKDRLENPLRSPLPGSRAKPAIVDLDNDGDYDIVVREDYSYLRLFNNNGDGTFDLGQSLYATYDGPYGPYQSRITVGSPSFMDVDADGDMDLVLGIPYYGITKFFLNNNDGTAGSLPTFTHQTGPWNPITKTGNPFDNLGISHYGQSFFFIDHDGDSDLDVLITERGVLSTDPQLFYYENTGSSQFTPGTIPGLPALPFTDYGLRLRAILSDIDQDGELDILLGRDNGDILFLKGGGGIFTNQTGPWDPVGKTGNPFDEIDLGNSSYPALMDFDLDGDQDIVFGYSAPYLQNIEPLALFENKGNGVFDRKIFLDNPFGGAATGSEAVPYFVDIDGDGQLDALLGGKYGNSLTYYKNNNGVFDLVLGPESPFNDILTGFTFWEGAKPVYIDIDDDGDLDLVTGSYGGNITFFKNESGILTRQVMDAANPFFALGTPTNYDYLTGNYYSVHISGNYNTAIDMVDIDNDGDLDLFSGDDDGTVDFFKNIGTRSAPQFEIPVDPTENPLDESHIPEFLTNFFDFSDTQPRFIDLDHDGDWDLLLGGRYYEYSKYYGNAIFYFENVGTPEVASFEMRRPALLPGTNYNPNPGLIDADGDGDLDVFIGDSNGVFEFYENQNPAAAIVVNPSEITYIFGSGPVVVDATIVLSDVDNDFVTQAIAAIQGYQTGDVLTFTPQGNVNGVFDTNTGVLTLSGVDDLNVYQAVLRSVMYNYTGPQPGKAEKTSKAGRTVVVPKNIQFSVFDSDFTTPVIQAKAIVLTVPNLGPSVVSSSGTSDYVGTSVVIDGSVIVSDPDDADLAGATVQISSSTFIAGEDNLLFTNQNGITGSYNAATGILTLSGVASVPNYQTALQSVRYPNLSSPPTFIPRTIEFMVDDGESLSTVSTKSLNIINQSPVITPSPLSVDFNGLLTLDLNAIASDPDNNLDPTSFNIIQPPASGATASITGSTLTVNYASTNFVGTDNLIVEVYDSQGSQTQATLTIAINNQAPVIVPTSLSLGFRQILTLDLNTITTDPESNLDPTTFGIVQQPANGVATILNSILTIDYSASNFAGSDNVIIEVFDLAGARAEATVVITVNNVAPVIVPTQLKTVVQSIATIDLLTLVSDADNNLDPSTFSIFQQPISGATASISGTSLTVDYTMTTFAGLDNLIVEVFDLAGERAEATITIQVEGDIVVRNGMSPNGDGKNDYFQLDNITTLGAQNTVKIFNRWGDKVFEIEDYDNQNRRFEGRSDDGKDLPSGVYFFKITFINGRPELSGYLTLKR